MIKWNSQISILYWVYLLSAYFVPNTVLKQQQDTNIKTPAIQYLGVWVKPVGNEFEVWHGRNIYRSPNSLVLQNNFQSLCGYMALFWPASYELKWHASPLHQSMKIRYVTLHLFYPCCGIGSNMLRWLIHKISYCLVSQPSCIRFCRKKD